MVKVTRTNAPSAASQDEVQTAPITTPSQASIEMGTDETSFHDDAGRAYVVRTMSRLEFMRFARMMGPENTQNVMWMNMAMAAACVRSIDGKAFRLPTSPDMVEMRIENMSDDALAKIGEWVTAIGKKNLSDAEKVDAAKN